MSETHEAAALAEWLAGGANPGGLDPMVAETVYALRPDLAPAHQLSIDAVLDELLEGPLVDPVVASALRSWLAAGPGTPPPRRLPIGVVEATYALRPEMAPAPSLSIDDILESLTDGPLAEAPIAVQPHADRPGTDVMAAAPHRAALSSANTVPPWWRRPALGAIAVAAVALLIVMPGAEKAMEASSPFDGNDAVVDAPKQKSVGNKVASSQADHPASTPPPTASAEPTVALKRAPAKKAARRERSAPPPVMASTPPLTPPPPSPMADEAPVSLPAAIPSSEALDEAEPVESVRAASTKRGWFSRGGVAGGRAAPAVAEKAVEMDAEYGSAMEQKSAVSGGVALALEGARQAESSGDLISALAIVNSALDVPPARIADRLDLLVVKERLLTALGREEEAVAVRATLMKLRERR